MSSIHLIHCVGIRSVSVIRDAANSVVNVTRPLIDAPVRAVSGLANMVTGKTGPSSTSVSNVTPLPVLVSNEVPGAAYSMDIEPLYSVTDDANEVARESDLDVWSALTSTIKDEYEE